MFGSTICLCCICQWSKTEILLSYMFFRGLILNYVSEIRRILKFGTSNTNLLLNFNEVSTISTKSAILEQR